MSRERRRGSSIFLDSRFLLERIRVFGCTLISLLAIGGCAAPGAPVARQPAVAPAITDLAAEQLGENVILTFTLPKETLQGQPLGEPPRIEIFREFSSIWGPYEQRSPPEAPQKMILEVDSQATSQYREGARMRIPTLLTPADFAAHAGNEAVFAVRTQISGHASADSNLAVLRILSPPDRVENLKSQVTKSAVELSWTPVPIPSAEALGRASLLYRVYRAEITPGATRTGVATGSTGGLVSLKFQFLGEVSSPTFSDTNFGFGQAYAYVVRSLARYESGEVESENSNLFEVTPQNTFPPAAPEGLVAAVIPAIGTEPAHIELSWAISPETDMAGYNVYRSESASSLGQKLNGQLLPAPVYRDHSAIPGQHYFYRVSAVDRLGKESAPSAMVAVTFGQPKEQERH
jgi:hypothetical protein